jgi:G3E family GTPase
MTLKRVGLVDLDKKRFDVSGWLKASENSENHVLSQGIKTFVFRYQKPISRAVLGLWLMELVRDYGAQLLRLKGIVNVEFSPKPVIVQGAQYRIYPPAHLPEWPSEEHDTQIVFILRDLTPEVIIERFNEMKKRLQLHSGD